MGNACPVRDPARGILVFIPPSQKTSGVSPRMNARDNPAAFPADGGTPPFSRRWLAKRGCFGGMSPKHGGTTVVKPWGSIREEMMLGN